MSEIHEDTRAVIRFHVPSVSSTLPARDVIMGARAVAEKRLEPFRLKPVGKVQIESWEGDSAELSWKVVRLEPAPAPKRGERRNPHCSNCGDTRGGPVGHEISECTWESKP